MPSPMSRGQYVGISCPVKKTNATCWCDRGMGRQGKTVLHTPRSCFFSVFSFMFSSEGNLSHQFLTKIIQNPVLYHQFSDVFPCPHLKTPEQGKKLLKPVKTTRFWELQPWELQKRVGLRNWASMGLEPRWPRPTPNPLGPWAQTHFQQNAPGAGWFEFTSGGRFHP